MGNKATGMGEKEEKGSGGGKTTTWFHHRGPGEAERMLGNDEPLVTLPVKRLRALLMAASPRVSPRPSSRSVQTVLGRDVAHSSVSSFFSWWKKKKRWGKKAFMNIALCVVLLRLISIGEWFKYLWWRSSRIMSNANVSNKYAANVQLHL